MAKMEEHEVDDILARDKPGFSVVKRRNPLRAIENDAPTDTEPGLELHALRQAYLGEDAAAEPNELAADDGGDDPDDAIVVVEPDQRPGFDPSPGPKTVIISGKEHRVIAEQG